MRLSVFAIAAPLAGTLALPTASDFSLVGFAKDNPIGTTTGGEGGTKVTVTTPEALVSAVAGMRKTSNTMSQVSADTEPAP